MRGQHDISTRLTERTAEAGGRKRISRIKGVDQLMAGAVSSGSNTEEYIEPALSLSDICT
jgi:hypothetical protein